MADLMKKILLTLALALSTSFGLMAKETQTSKYAADIHGGTLGFGLQVHRHLNDNLNLRLGFNTYETDEDVDDGDLTYNGELKLFTIGALVDWHPFDSGFRVSGGLYISQNEIEVTAKTNAVGTYTIGNEEWRIGTAEVLGEAEFANVAPYVGLGWGRGVGKGRWSFLIDAGVLSQGSPDTNLDVKGNNTVDRLVNGVVVETVAINSAVFQNSIDDQRDELESDLESLEIYPVLSIGVAYRF